MRNDRNGLRRALTPPEGSTKPSADFSKKVMRRVTLEAARQKRREALAAGLAVAFVAVLGVAALCIFCGDWLIQMSTGIMATFSCVLGVFKLLSRNLSMVVGYAFVCAFFAVLNFVFRQYFGPHVDHSS